MKVYSRLYFQNISSSFDSAQLFGQEKKTGKLWKCLHSVDSTTCSMHELLICQGFHLRIQEEIKSQMGCIVINRATHSIYIYKAYFINVKLFFPPPSFLSLPPLFLLLLLFLLHLLLFSLSLLLSSSRFHPLNFALCFSSVQSATLQHEIPG